MEIVLNGTNFVPIIIVGKIVKCCHYGVNFYDKMDNVHKNHIIKLFIIRPTVNLFFLNTSVNFLFV